MRTRSELKPVARGGVIGLGLGKYTFVGGGVALLLAASTAFAGPEGAQVVAGSARIRQNGNRTVIRTSDRAVIDYTSFDIGRNESVRFIQPNSNSRVLNRIDSARPTTIDGSLRANGRVYIVNPNGVIFSGSSMIDVPHLYAAAGHMSTADFMGGIDRFTGVQGDVVNQGRIHADTAALIGAHVANTGVIVSDADDGVVAMVSGEDVTLTPRGGTMSVTIAGLNGAETAAGGQAAVENSGTIKNREGSTLMVAGDLYSLAIRNTGSVKSRNIELDGGAGDVEVSGRLDAADRRVGGRGGTISVTGEEIAVRDAVVDASGSLAGGTVRLGGDVRGQGEMAHASNTSVDSTSTVRADALRRGAGGSVVVYAEGHTSFGGTASARGGKMGGDGGFVETSGKQTLDVDGAIVKAGGVKSGTHDGKNGQWLLDPTDMVIDAAAATAIVASLDSGTDVTVETGAAGADAGNITVDSAIAKTDGGDATLTLRAANDLVVNQAITSTSGALNVNLLANNADGSNTDPDPTMGSVIFNNDGLTTDGRIDANGGAVVAEGVDFTLNGMATITADSVTLRANSSVDQSIGVAGGVGLFTVSAGELAALTTSEVTIETASRDDAADIGAIDLTPQNFDITVGAGSVTADALTVAAGRSVTLRADAGAVTANGAVSAANGTVTILGDDAVLDGVGSSVTAETVRLVANGDRTIGVGGPGDFALNPTEIANITANTLEIESAGAGDITLGNSVDPMMPIAPNAVDVALRTQGAIREVGLDDLVDIQIAGRLTLVSGTGIGDPGTDDGTGMGPLDIDVGELDASVSGTGGIHVKDTGGVDVVSATTADGAVSIRTGGALNITDISAQQTTPAGRTLELVASGGSIAATGTVASNGNVHIETTQTDADISLADADISDAMGVRVTLLTTGAGGDASIVNANGLTLQDTAVGGNLSLTATTGDIFDANTLTVGGDASFTTLNDADIVDLNTLDVAGSISVATATDGNANLVNAQAIDLAMVDVGGSFAATATTGDITSSGTIAVADVANFTTSQADADIIVSQLSAGGVRLTTSGSGGDAIISVTGPLTFGASTVGGNLAAASTGAINDAAALTVDGAASFTTLNNTGAAITLDETMNVFGAITARSRDAADSADAGGNITIVERGIPGNTRMDVDAISTTGTISLTAPDIAINTGTPGAAISAGSGGITLQPNIPATTIGIDGAGDFSLDLAELQELATTGTVTIGAANSGAIIIGGLADIDLTPEAYNLRVRGGATTFLRNLTLADDRALTLETGGVTSIDGGTDVTIGGANGRLAINSTGPVDLQVSISRLAAMTTSGGMTIDNAAMGLEIASIGLVTGVQGAMDGDVNITTLGALTLSQAVTATGTGEVMLAAADGMIDGVMTDPAVVGAAISLTTTAGSIDGSGGSGPFKVETTELTVSAPDGINIANSATDLLRATLTSDMGAAVLSSGGSISTNGTDWTADSFSITAGGAAPEGVVTIGDSVTADNGDITIVANDLDIVGGSTMVSAAMHDVVISRATDGTIGVGDIASEDMTITNAELGAITAANLVIGDAVHTTGITVRDVGATDSQNIDTVRLVAELDNASIAFTGTESTFNELDASADAGIEVDSNIIADAGDLSLDADADMDIDDDAPGVMGEHQDQLFVRPGRTITTQSDGGNITLRGRSGGSGDTAGILAEGDLVLDSNQDITISSAITVGGTLTLDAEGSVTFAGAGEGMVLNISANNGINFAESVTNQSGNLSINADADADGMGDFSLATGKSLTTSDGDLSIVAADFNLDGSIAAGTGSISLTRSTSGDIAIGDFTPMAGRMTISGDELSRIECDGLRIGGGDTAAIMVDGVTEAQSMGIAGLLTLDAGTTLTFSGGDSTFHSLRGDADEDITVSSNLTTGGALTLNADVDSNDSGALTISGDLATGDGNFSGTGTDLALTGSLNAGTGSVTLSRSADGNITVDNAPDAMGRMVIDDSELQNITAGDLIIGGGATQAITVRNFTETDGAGISGLTTFTAGTVLTFNGTSTFKTLTGEANDRVTVNGNLTTSTGDLSLNGNANNENDTDDKIEIGSGRILQSAGDLTLTSSRGGIEGIGAMTLRADGGVNVNSTLTSSGETTIAADFDADGTGDFTLAAATTLSTSGSNLFITGADVVLNGNIVTGGGAASIDRSTPGTIAVGAFDNAAGRMTVSGAELARIVATGLTIGGVNTTQMNVNGVTDSNSNFIAGTTTLAALGDGGRVNFETAASRFNALAVRADTAIVTSVAVITDSGAMTLNAGANTPTHDDGTIALGANLFASSTGGATGSAFFDINLNSPVRLRSNTILEAEDITFASRVNSANSTLRTLTLNSHLGGTTTFRGTVGGDNRLAGLFTNADGFTRLGADIITTRNGMTFEDRVTLLDDVMVRDFGAGILFNNAINSDSASTPRSLTAITRLTTSGTVNDLPRLSFTGDIGTSNPLSSLYLNYSPGGINGRDNIPRVATIVIRPLDNQGNPTAITGSLRSFRIVTSDEFRMGQNEKMTVGGHIEIVAGSRATLGDVVSLGDMTVTAPQIRLLRREAHSLSARDPNRLTGTGIRVEDVDRGTDYVSGGRFTFSTVPVAVGVGANPQFGSPSGQRDSAGNLDGFIFQTYQGFANSLIDVSNPIITQDLKASGPSDTNFATALAGAIPRESRQNDVSQEETISSASFSELEQLGVFPRDLTDEERVAGLIGWSTYDDYPETAGSTEADFRTAVTRLPGPQATAVLALHQAIFYTTEKDPQTGETRTVSLAPEIRRAFEDSIKRYRAQAGSSADRVDPIALREYIERVPEEGESRAYARQLQRLLKDIELLGLTPRELRKCKSAVLRLVRPSGLGTREQFETFLKTDIRALEQSSVVPGTEHAG